MDAQHLPTVSALGDAALIVTFAHEPSWAIGLRVRSVANCLRNMHIPSVTDVVPAYTTLAVYFDPTIDRSDSIAGYVQTALESADMIDDVDSRTIEIPVRYDGPDIGDVAQRTGMSVHQVIEKHCSRTYRAYMSGFVPGFVYLGNLDPSLVIPRRSTPRVRVPAGSVAIAAMQTAVYPLETPGGWHLIGSTDAIVFDPKRSEPALIRTGDIVRFVEMPR
ncbi:MAG: 5-oxoprolinase subunit PxpB [Gemmatimonadota bacterium]|nr:5-oxoprolinase subunit PxpB [Gemmatimonadota bacterium]